MALKVSKSEKGDVNLLYDYDYVMTVSKDVISCKPPLKRLEKKPLSICDVDSKKLIQVLDEKIMENLRLVDKEIKYYQDDVNKNDYHSAAADASILGIAANGLLLATKAKREVLEM